MDGYKRVEMNQWIIMIVLNGWWQVVEWFGAFDCKKWWSAILFKQVVGYFFYFNMFWINLFMCDFNLYWHLICYQIAIISVIQIVILKQFYLNSHQNMIKYIYIYSIRTCTSLDECFLCFDSAPDWKPNWKVTWFCIG